MEKALFCWSGGKDSAMALYHVRNTQTYEVVTLLTSITEDTKRICHHGFPLALANAQAKALGLPLVPIEVPKTHEGIPAYEEHLRMLHESFRSQGVTTVIFGDIYLEDLRSYRESKLAQVGMKAFFPLWQRDTRELISEFWQLGFKAYVCSAKEQVVMPEDVGTPLDSGFISRLAPGSDPCGEKGEYHSLVYDGPIFTAPLKVRAHGAVYQQDGMMLQDFSLSDGP